MKPARRPRYEEIADHLRDQIALLQPGDILPSETELSEQFEVSRMTARHAVQTLEREHLLHRRKGKGTFVSQPTVPRMLGSPLSFTENMSRRGMVASSMTLDARLIEPSPEDVTALELTTPAKVGLLIRLRLADDIPMAIERAVLAPFCTEVIAGLGDGSLHIAFEAIGLTPSRADAQVLARAATSEERDLLDLDRSSPVLCERRVIYDQNGRPLEHTETRYAANRHVFDVTMYRDEGGR